MIPLRDVIPSRTFPFVTISIIVLNAMAWLLELSFEPRELEQFLYAYGVVPANDPIARRQTEIESAIANLKARRSSLPPAAYDAELERLLIELARLSRP